MKPKVSILVPTYNQERYISQTIKSVINQKTNFPFEILIGEDCSTDKTNHICQKFAKKFPHKIRLISNQSNFGLLKNFANLLSKSKGKYIAILGGDDYWIDNCKLQKQIDFLEENPDFSLVFTNSKRYLEEKQKFIKNFYDHKKQQIYSCRDLILYNFIPALTAVFKKNPNFRLPKNWNQYYPEDWPLFILISQNKKIEYLPDITAVYRISKNGIGSGIPFLKRLQKTIPTIKILKEEIDQKYVQNLQNTIKDYTLYAAFFAFFNKNTYEFKKNIIKYKKEKNKLLILELINSLYRTIKRILLKTI